MADAIDRSNEGGVQVIQAIPGQLRVRVPQLADDASLAQQLEQFAIHTGGVTSIRINRAAASVVITYIADTSTKAKIRSCLAHLVESDRQASSSPAPMQLTPADDSLHEEQESHREDLQAQLANLRESMAAQTEEYESLQQKYQQQSELIQHLQQQLAEQQSSPQTPPEPSDSRQQSEQVHLQSLARIGEWQLNRWRRRFR